MKKLIGRLVCLVKGHQRGKRGDVVRDGHGFVRFYAYSCPRCGKHWSRLAPKKDRVKHG
jgi:hypothetical protein